MDAGAQTVANFLKVYNPSVVGGSLGHHIVEVCGTLRNKSYPTATIILYSLV